MLDNITNYNSNIRTLISIPLSKRSNTTTPPQYGVTKPVTMAQPQPEDIKNNKLLADTMNSFDLCDSPSELSHRVRILEKLNTLVKQWIDNVGKPRSPTSTPTESLGGKVCAFGSYQIGVYQKDADIDAVCIAPRNIDHSMFFTSFVELLKKQAEVTDCRPIREAFVPLIKMKFDGIETDLLFSRLALKEIPDDLDLRCDNLLRNLDPQSVRSLNGRRIAEELLNLVPNVDNFRIVLRTIKLWAKRRGIYSNSLGYFGGITWALLVARVCQLYPNAAPSTLVHKFFLVFTTWNWPRPVLLTNPKSIDLGFPVWNPSLNPSDRYHLMPIITPAYPQQNSTYNVNASTKKIIIRELSRGLAITKELVIGKGSWDQLFDMPSFFCRYRHFVVLSALSDTPDDHLEWCGFVDSKVRLLVGQLDQHGHVSLAHPHPKRFEFRQTETSKDSAALEATFCTMWFIGLKFEPAENVNVDFTGSIMNFAEIVNAQAESILKDGMEMYVRHVKRAQLDEYLDADILNEDRRAAGLQPRGGNKRSAPEPANQDSKKRRLEESRSF